MNDKKSVHEELHKLLQDFLGKFPSPSEKNVIDQYCGKFIDILRSFDMSSLDTSEIRAKLASALQREALYDYIESACELSVASYFHEKFPKEFLYQVDNENAKHKSGPPKNFDFSFMAENYTFNVEVKTLSRDPSKSIESSKVFLPQEQAQALYNAGFRSSSNCAKNVRGHLLKANSQLTRPLHGASVVVLCCADPDEFADVLECLVGANGMLMSSSTSSDKTEQSPRPLMPSISDLKNIDAIVICYASLRHHAVIDTRKTEKLFKKKGGEIDNGEKAWNYRNTLPVGLFLRKKPENYNLEDMFAKVFVSYHSCIAEMRQRNGDDLQAAVFELFNESIRANGGL